MRIGFLGRAQLGSRTDRGSRSAVLVAAPELA
jgi:hypothetical protein